jgi:HSP20 family molecular chaperone IbpA
MFGQIRSPFEDIFNFQREADSLFNRLWSELPARAARNTSTYPFQVHTSVDSWKVEIPMPGINPAQVSIEVTASTISVRAEQEGGHGDGSTTWEQSLTLPQFLNLDAMRASHRHGHA